MIDLKFFGRGAGFYPALGNTNAWLSRGDHLVMLDCGETTFDRLMKHPGLSNWQQVTTLITHLHADHVGSLGTFLAYNLFVLKRKVHLVHPVDQIRDLLRLQGVGEEVYTFSHQMPPIDGFTARALPVHHAPDMACFGYELEDQDECVYYSGDAGVFPQAVADGLASGRYARVYHDVASDPKATHHCPVASIEALVSKELRPRVFAMHIDRAGFEDTLREKGFSVVQSPA